MRLEREDELKAEQVFRPAGKKEGGYLDGKEREGNNRREK